MTALFVTGSGTDIGKTYITELLVRREVAEGRPIRVLKPVISGFDPAHPADSDTGRLLAAQGRALSPANIDAMSPWRYSAPLSPDMAAARENTAVPFDEVAAFCRREIAAAEGDRVDLLIEGVGGVMVPLDETRTVLDLIETLEIPVLVIVGSYLGTISHTLTACAVLTQREIAIDRVVISETPDSTVDLAETQASLARFLSRIGDGVPVEGVRFSP